MKKCEKCGATWMEGQLYWQGTGKPGKDIDLAGLVCNNLRDDDPDAEKCINPAKGQLGGDTGITVVVRRWCSLNTQKR